MATVVGIERARSDHISRRDRYQKVHAADPVRGDVLQQQLATVADVLDRGSDGLALRVARAIGREVRLSPSFPAVPFDMVVADCAAHIQALATAVSSGDDVDTSAATEAGARAARHGVPLSSVMDAYGVACRRLWESVTGECPPRTHVNGETLHVFTTKLLAAQGLFTRAMAASHRDEQMRRLTADQDRRTVLIDALLHGRFFDR